ncbi:protein ABHD18 [Nilaparvata lugens]|uniref:protein ABHD18 n=1 Tax=Nilaparvata lugens TaxID=108931 RepID=UPI00193CEB5F|nr:protein ABHD18 [Nilaparvata lugens]
MPVNRLDQIYRTILNSKYFIKGWGEPENLKRLFQFRKVMSNRETCYKLVPEGYPVTIDKEEEHSDCRIVEGHFTSPFINHLPGLLPPEAETAYFQAILPTKWNSNHYKPVCIHLAGTGDHHFWRRRMFLAKPLLKEAGIGAILLENPFYGTRKPKDQVRSILHNVSDIFVMGGCLMMESLVLLHWSEKLGFGPLGVTGLSMGGHMASLAATAWPKPLVLVPCLSWSTASSAFTEGVLSGAINWDLLTTQYQTDEVFKSEIEKMVTIIEDDAFLAGQQFAKDFPNSMKNVDKTQYCGCEGGNIASTNLKNKTNESSSNASNEAPNTTQTESCTHDTDTKRSRVQFSDSISSETLKADSADSGGKMSSNLFSRLFHLGGGGGRGKSAPAAEQKSASPPLTPLGADDRRDLLHLINEKLRSGSGAKSKTDASWRELEAHHFMRGIMDECTHLRNFARPVDTSLITVVCARNDGYVPRDSVTPLADIWPGLEVRYVDAGHVTAFLLHQNVFRSVPNLHLSSVSRQKVDHAQV